MNKDSFNFGSFCAGGLVVALILVFIYAVALNPNKSSVTKTSAASNSTAEKPSASKTTETETETDATSAKIYDVNQKSFDMTLKGGEKIHLTTPEKYYSLTDQYLESIGKYYGKTDVKSDSMFVVGDGGTQNESSIILNANKTSDLENLLKQLYGDKFDSSKIKMAEAYTYMKTGKLPKELPDNYKIKEAGEWTVDGIKFKAYKVSFDTTYNTGSKDKSEAKQTVHTDEICCYTDTSQDDTCEIIINQQKFDQKKAIKALKKFIGAK